MSWGLSVLCQSAISPFPKIFGPATPSRLRQALLNDITSSPSLVTATDFLPPLPLNGKDGNGSIKSANGIKRVRVDDHANLEQETRDVDVRSAPTNCRNQVALALGKDRRLYEAKTKMFQDCADAIDKTLQKAGIDLYPYAKEFSAFFASCLNEWLGTHRASLPEPVTPGPRGNAEKLTYARVVCSSVGGGSHSPIKMNHQTASGREKAPVVTRLLPKRPSEDLRIFVRMDNSRLEPYGVKSTLVRRLNLDHQELRDVTRCASGFALHPRDGATQKKLLAFRGEIVDILKAKDMERHTVWYHYKVQGCPRKVMSAEGLTIDITDSIVADEVEAQTGARPVRCIISRNTVDTDIETIWLVSFTQEVTKPFRLFAHSMNSRQSRRDPRIIQCESCLRFHGKNYRCGKKICPNCACPTHEGACDKPVLKCVNCSSPQAATSEKCLARPKVVNGAVRRPTTEQLQEIRLAGERARSRAFDEATRDLADRVVDATETLAGRATESDGPNRRGSKTRMEVDSLGLANKRQQSNQEADTIVVSQ